MLLYYNRYDAQLEVEAVLNDHTASAFATCQNGEPFRRQVAAVVSLAAFLLIATLLLKSSLLSSEFRMALAALPPPAVNALTVTLPETPIKTIQPKITPTFSKPAPPPQTAQRQAVRSLSGDYQTRTAKTREAVEDSRPYAAVDRSSARPLFGSGRTEEAGGGEVRTIPRIDAPVIRPSGTARAAAPAQGAVRTAAVVETAEQSDIVRRGTPGLPGRSTTESEGDRPEETERAEYTPGSGPVGSPEGRGGGSAVGLSHSNLDPYHYQMVNLCLRLCVQSMFMRQGSNLPEPVYPSDWLRLRKSADENYLSVKHAGTWREFRVQRDRLEVLSDLSFISLPSGASSADDLNAVIEGVTRDLCRWLRYENCLENL